MKINIEKLKRIIRETIEAQAEVPQAGLRTKPFMIFSGDELDGVAVGNTPDEAVVKWLIEEMGMPEAAAQANARHINPEETSWPALQKRYMDIKAEIVKKKEVLAQIKKAFDSRKIDEQMVATGAGVNTVAQGSEERVEK